MTQNAPKGTLIIQLMMASLVVAIAQNLVFQHLLPSISAELQGDLSEVQMAEEKASPATAYWGRLYVFFFLHTIGSCAFMRNWADSIGNRPAIIRFGFHNVQRGSSLDWISLLGVIKNTVSLKARSIAWVLASNILIAFQLRDCQVSVGLLIWWGLKASDVGMNLWAFSDLSALYR